jgi:DNA-binding NarL/FixJ family response regulator
MPIRIAIIDDHWMVIDALCLFLETCSDIAVVGAAFTATDGLALVDMTHPNVVVVDLCIPGTEPELSPEYSYGIGLISEIKQQHSSTAILALTGFVTSIYQEFAVRAGAQGVLSKSCRGPEIADAIRKVSKGQTLHSCDEIETPISSLTNREMEVLELISRGRTDQQIAGQLHISLGTAGTHRKNIYSKLHISNRVEAVALAFRQPGLRVISKVS